MSEKFVWFRKLVEDVEVPDMLENVDCALRMIDQMLEIVEVAQFVDLRACTECSLHVVRAVQLLLLGGAPCAVRALCEKSAVSHHR